MTSQYQTSRRTFTAADLTFMNGIPSHLRSVDAVMVNGENELDGWKLTAHRSEYRQAYKAIVDAIETREAWNKVMAGGR